MKVRDTFTISVFALIRRPIKQEVGSNLIHKVSTSLNIFLFTCEDYLRYKSNQTTKLEHTVRVHFI